MPIKYSAYVRILFKLAILLHVQNYWLLPFLKIYAKIEYECKTFQQFTIFYEINFNKIGGWLKWPSEKMCVKFRQWTKIVKQNWDAYDAQKYSAKALQLWKKGKTRVFIT